MTTPFQKEPPLSIPELDPVKKQMDSGSLVFAIYLAGGDDFIANGALELMEADLKKTSTVITTERLDAEPAKTEAWARLGEIAIYVPMFDDGTLVLITGCGKGEKLPSELKRMISSWPPHVRLVLTGNRKSETSPMAKAIKEVGVAVAVADLKDRAAQTLVERLAAENKITLAPGVSFLILDLVGPDRGSIEAAVTALADYLGPGGKATAENLQGLVLRSRKSNPWDLDEAISNRNLKLAIKIATRDVEDAKDPKSQAIRIMYGVNRHARNLLIACDLVKQRVDDKTAMKSLNLSWPFMWERLRKATSRYTHHELVTFLNQAVDTDLRFKRGNVAPAVLVTDLLTRLIGPGR
jgi:DNA polymerase III delta subunit